MANIACWMGKPEDIEHNLGVIGYCTTALAERDQKMTEVTSSNTLVATDEGG